MPQPEVTLDGVDYATPWTDEMRQTVLAGTRYLAGRCDGAQTLDGMGFDGTDTTFGRTVAGLSLDVLSDDVLCDMYLRLRKYRGQLNAGGIDIDAMDTPPNARRIGESSIRVVMLDGNSYVLQFGYDAGLVMALKREVSGPRRWDPESKQWLIPLAKGRELAAFAKRHGFSVAFDARQAMREAAPPPSTQAKGTVAFDADENELVMRFDYNREAVAQVGALRSRRFTRSDSCWRAPMYLVRPVRQLAARYNWELAPEVEALPDIDPDNPPVTVAHVDGELRVRLAFAEDRVMAGRLRAINAQYLARDQAWHLPEHAALSLLHALDGAEIQPEGVLDDLLARLRSLVELSSEVDGPPLTCEFNGTLRGHQLANVEYARAGEGRLFITDDVGGGKTASALAIAEQNEAYPMLVLCPAGLKLNWRAEARRFLPHRVVDVLSGTRSSQLFGRIIQDPDIVIANYDILEGWAEEFKRSRFQTMVCDESHLLKERKTQRTQAVTDVADTIERLKVLLSATPVKNNRKEFGPQVRILGQDLLDRFGGYKAIERDPNINLHLRSAGVYAHHEKHGERGFLKNLPLETHAPVPIDPDPVAMVEYRKAEKDIMRWLAEKAAAYAEEMGLDPHDAAVQARVKAGGAEQLVRIGVLKELAVQAKMAAMDEWIAGFLESDRKLLIFADRIKTVEHFADRFSIPKVYGQTKKEERDRLVRKFQSEPNPQAISMNMGVGGIGLTLTAASDVCFAELGWTPGDHDQAIGRVHGRLNDPKPGTGHYFIALGTIDERIVALLDAKRDECANAVVGTTDFDTVTGKLGESILGDLLWELTEDALG